MSSASGLDPRERAVLALLRAAPGPLGWHPIATRLPLRGVLPGPDLIAALGSLCARGLLSAGEAEPRRWALTDAGRAALARAEALAAAGGPGTAMDAAPAAPVDGDDEVARWAEALAGPPAGALARLTPRLADPGLPGLLLRVLARAPESAPGVVLALACVDPPARRELALAAASDPRPAVRAALFAALAPPRLDVPGQSARLLDDATLDALLRQGLADPDPQIRARATDLAFGTCRGGHHTAALLAGADGDDRDLCWRSLLALGGARDRASLGALLRRLDGPDLLLAGAAARALACRDDGRAECQRRAQEDPRDEVRRAARHGLAAADARRG